MLQDRSSTDRTGADGTWGERKDKTGTHFRIGDWAPSKNVLLLFVSSA